MIGNRQLHTVITEAHQARAKVVLAGDTKQLPSIDAGGVFEALARRIPTHKLTRNFRLQNHKELAAVDAIRTNNIDQALHHLNDAGSVITANNADLLRQQMVTDYLAANDQGKDAVMLAGWRADVRDLNQRTRAVLKTRDELTEPVLLANGDEFAIDDVVLTSRNLYKHGLINGERGTVVGITDNGLAIDIDDKGRRVVPFNYIEHGHLGHGYARTVHATQGLTCDVNLLLGDDALFQELGYTGLTRGREANRLYVVANNGFFDDSGDELAHVRAALGQSRAQSAAIDFPHDH